MTAALAAPGTGWPALRDAASAPYRSAGRMAWGFARGKLGFDPVFPHLLRQGLIAPQSRVLDIGCGQGLIASLLIGADALAARGRWPSGWAAAPSGARVTGIELVPRNVERARAALGPDAATFICGDLRSTPFPTADAIVILDVLHYITLAEQDAVLARVREALPAGGRLLLRVGDAGAATGFRLSQWADAVVSLLRGHRAPRRGRPLGDWIERLEALGFAVRSEPMSRGTPFANVLLVGQLRTAAPRNGRRAAPKPARIPGERPACPSAEASP